MTGDQQEIFLLALNHFYAKYKDKGGSQKKLAVKLGVSQSYISAVLKSTKKASIELQERLANILYGPYEDFLSIGRRIQNGLDPEIIIKSERDEEVESLINKLSHYIRDYQRIEKQLIDTKNFYKILVDKMQSGILVTDRDDKIFYVNTWLLNKMGIPRESLIGSAVPEANTTFPMARLDEFQNYYLNAKETMEPQHFESMRIITPSGKEAYRTGWCIPVLEHREYMGMIVTIGDLTEEVLLRKKLQDETWLLRSAMESMDEVGWMILDRSKHIIKRNTMYQKMFNVPEEVLREDIYSKNIEWVKHVMCDPDKFVQSSLELPIQGKKVVHEFELLDGRRIRRTSSPFFDANEDFLGWNILINDITSQ